MYNMYHVSGYSSLNLILYYMLLLIIKLGHNNRCLRRRNVVLTKLYLFKTTTIVYLN